METVQSPPADVLSPGTQAHLMSFARACRAAARAVAMYPASHPSIRTTLEQLVRASGAATTAGSFRLTILPDGLLVDGAAPSRTDVGVVDLAAILHRHAVGTLTLHGASDADTWRSLLALLARAPEDLRADGGISHLWLRTGGPSIEVHEVDFGEVLRDHVGGDAASLASVLTGYLRGSSNGENLAAARRELIALAERPEELRGVLGALGGSPEAAGGFLHLARALLSQTAREAPSDIEATLRALSKMAGELPAATLTQVLGQRGTAAAVVEVDGPAGPTKMDIVESMSGLLDDRGLASLVTGSIAAEGQATSDLVNAFQQLAPDAERRDRVITLIDREVAAPGGTARVTPGTWQQARAMLLSSHDERYVSDAYARELRFARTRPVDVEDTQDDPPERIAAWLESVSDAALRGLDVQLVHDLLVTEPDIERWTLNLALATGFIDDLTRVGQIEAAARLAEAIASEAGPDRDPGRRSIAEQARARLCASPIVRHVVPRFRAADADSLGTALRLCRALGPGVVPAVSRAIAREEDAKVRRRLQDVILEFGPDGRQALEQLVTSDDPDIRRTVVYLLREFGGSVVLPNLEPLLADPEPRVQREAIRTVALAGDDRAYALLLRAALEGAGNRQVLLETLASLTDERAAPCFRHLVLEFNDRSAPRDIFVLALNALGRLGGFETIETLRAILARGVWWRPFRTAAIRTAAAEALATIDTPAAIDALRSEAKAGGGRGRAARRALARQAGGR